jgi:hypothetical protein
MFIQKYNTYAFPKDDTSYLILRDTERNIGFIKQKRDTQFLVLFVM